MKNGKTSSHQNPTTTRPTTDDDTIHQIGGPRFAKHWVLFHELDPLLGFVKWVSWVKDPDH